MTPCVCNGNMAACEDRETQLFQIRNALLIMFFQSGYKDNGPRERGPFIELTYQSVIYVENANSNNCVPAQRKNFSFMSDDAQNSADTTHAAGGPATTMGAATNVAVVHREFDAR
jgi:hypothetical protein